MRTYNFLTEFPTLHPMDSYPCMSIHPLIPMIELFRNLTFKIQGQSHSSRSHNRNNILSTHIPFIPCWSALPFLRCSYFKLTLKFQGQGWGQSSKSQSESNILSTHIPLVPCQSFPFLTYSIFKIWPWKSRVKVMGEVTIQSHNVGLTSYRLTQLALPFLSYDFFQNLTLKFKGQGYGWGHISKSQCGSKILSTHIPFVPCQSALPFLKYSIFKIWPWKSNGINPSSGSKDMGSAKSGPSAAWFDKFLADGQTHMGQMGK